VRLPGAGDGLGPAGHLQFAKDGVNVGFDCARCYSQLAGDVAIRQPSLDQLQHLQLPPAQCLGSGSRMGASMVLSGGGAARRRRVQGAVGCQPAGRRATVRPTGRARRPPPAQPAFLPGL
jgi:hypothetical protein